MRTNTRMVIEKRESTVEGYGNYFVRKVVFTDGRYNKSYDDMVGTFIDEKKMREISECRFNQVQLEAPKS